jgi:deoxyribodipyrimidine photolyase-related protein
MILYLFNNQLFEKKYLPNSKEIKEIYLIEDPIFYGDRKKMKLKFNILKLQYQRLALISYKEYLEKEGYKVTLFDVTKVKSYPLKSEKSITLFDPVDHELREKIFKSKKLDITVLDNPNFILTAEQLLTYSKKTKSDSYSHHSFYNFVKEQIDLLVGVKSYDEDNRSKLPKNIKLPNLKCSTPTKKQLDEVTKYIKKQKYGFREYDDQQLIFPYTHKESKEWLSRFLEQRFTNFGKYQDAISTSNDFIYHSVISPMVNLGLLQPDYIIEQVKKYKSKVPMNSYEGFIRQLIGWREYQRLVYETKYQTPFPNYFKQKNKLSKEWYEAKTDIPPVDKAIKTAFKYGYLHHIERLMVMGNFMTLCRMKPDEQYRWFMEFSLDSYDWVMYQNIFMISYADGGTTMRKPYLSSANYILKMSDYKKGKWSEIWTALFYLFLADNKKELSKTIYIRNLKYWEKQSSDDHKKIRELVKMYIHS